MIRLLLVDDQPQAGLVVSDGTQSSNVATRTVNVQAVNDAPVNTVPGPQTTPYTTTPTFSTANGKPFRLPT